MALETFDYPDGTDISTLPEYTVWSGNFETENGALSTPSSASNSRVVRSSTGGNGITELVIPDAGSSANAGLIFRGVDSSNYWSLYANQSNNRVRLAKYVAGSGTTIYDQNFDGLSGDRVFRAECIGERIQIFLNGDLLATFYDPQFSDGNLVGIRCDSSDYSFPSLTYQSLSVPAPLSAPNYTQSGLGKEAIKVGEIATIHSQIVANGDSEEFWPYALNTRDLVDWPSVQYPVIMYSSTDHSIGNGGIYLRVYNKDLGLITDPASWEEWQNVSNRPEFDHIATKTCPIYSDPLESQTETPSVIVGSDGTVRMFYHTNNTDNTGYTGLNGAGLQNTHLASSPNGVDFTLTKRSVVTYDPRLEQGGGHTGYFHVIENPIVTLPYNYLGNGSHGGGSLDEAPMQAYWASNDLVNWEKVGLSGRQRGEIYKYAPDMNGEEMAFFLQSVNTMKKEGEYYRVVQNYRKDVSTGGDDAPFFPCEILIDGNFNTVAEPNFFTSLGESGSFDDSEMQHYTEVEYDGATYAFYKAASTTEEFGIGMLEVSSVPYDWNIIRSHADRNVVNEAGVNDTSSLALSNNTSISTNGDTASFTLPANGEAAYVSLPSIVLDDYDSIEIKLNRHGKVTAADIGGIIGFVDNINSPSNGVALRWPTQAENSPRTRMRFQLYESGELSEEITRKAVGISGLSYESPTAKQNYGIRIYPKERIAYVSDGVSLTTEHDLWSLDTSQPLIPVIKMFTNDGAEASTEFESLQVVTYSNEQINGLSLPNVVAGSDLLGEVGTTESLSGLVTNYDSVLWTCTSGQSPIFTTPTAVGTSITPQEEGVHIIRLTATNSDGSAYDELTYEVSAAVLNLPTVAAGEDVIALIGESELLDGATASDFDSLLWTCTSGQSPTFSDPTVLNPTVTFSEEGEYTLRLTATNADGSNYDELIVSVSEPVVNQPPTANAGPDQSVAAGATCILEGTASSDSDGTIVSYSWRKVSGPTIALANANQAVASFIAPSESTIQTLVFELTVTDDDGVTSTDTVTVTVAAVPDVADPLDPTLSVISIKSKVGIEDDIQSFGVVSLYQYTDNFILCEVASKSNAALSPDSFSQAEYRIVDNKGTNVVKLGLGTGIKEADGKFLIHINSGILNSSHKGSLKHQFVVWNQAGYKLPPIFGGTVNIIPVLEPTL